jgi:hypothetical protein
MTISSIEKVLQEAGASEAEASDLAPVLHINGWNLLLFQPLGNHPKYLQDAGTWLNDWRNEKRQLAKEVRSDRQKRLDAGYRSIPVGDPVYLNGRTSW